MRSKDITLSASLMAIYILVNVFSSVSPIAVSFLMTSALFGLFWPFFSTKLNLTFQGLRVGFNLVSFMRTSPKLLNYMRIQSIIGLNIFDWTVEEYGGVIDQLSYDLLWTLGNARGTPVLYILITGYLILACALIPYLFYKYFKYVGIFKRLPSF